MFFLTFYSLLLAEGYYLTYEQ